MKRKKLNKKKIARFSVIVLIAAAVVFFIFYKPVTAEESAEERAYYEEKYKNEPEPEGDVAVLLDFLDTCVGGQYIFGGQGTPITREFIDITYRMYPDYFDNGRLAYFNNIAKKAETNGFSFPGDYAWDCSDLWWDAVSKLDFYGGYADYTAHDTYYTFCTPITKDALAPGDLVFYMEDDGHISHMGIVGRHGYIYEACSSLVGVVYKRTVDKRAYNNIVNGGVIVTKNWNAFGRPRIFE